MNRTVGHNEAHATPLPPRTQRAFDKWSACGLTLPQKLTEAKRFCADLENDRAKLVAALRDLLRSQREYSSKQRTSCGDVLEAARDSFISADMGAEALLREIGESDV